MQEQQPAAQSSTMAQAASTGYGKPPLRVSYKVPFSLHLGHAITSIAHFFRIMQQPSPNHTALLEFMTIKNGNCVDSYSESLRLMYTDPATVHLAHNHWKVAEIKTYKDKDTKVKHEYLIAVLKLDDEEKGEVLLRIERQIQSSMAKELFTRGRSRSEPRPAHHSDKDSGGQPTTAEKRRAFKKWAVDEVALVTPNLVNQELVEHMVFDSALLLPQLIVLACIVNEHARGYNFFKKNCYWFCYIVTEMLKKHCKLTFPELPTRGLQATWKGLLVGALWTDVDCNFGELSLNYEVKWQTFGDKIEEMINHPDNKHLKDARKQVEEEARMRREVERRMEDETRHAEEEKCRAEEEKCRAEEEKCRAEEERRRAEESDKHAEEERRRAEDLARQLAELKVQLAQTKAI